MPAGTIKLTNNSTAVTGTGTSFTTELKANDFLVAVVGGVTYTLGVDSVTSNTALVLKTAYNGPTTASLAWTPIPNGTLVGITAQVAADVAKAIRGLNLDKANWQQIFSETGSVTVNLPDGSSYTGPAWNSITTSIGNKANKGANSDITSISGLTTALSVTQGGTGGKTAADARTGLGLGAAALLKDTGALGDVSKIGDQGGPSPSYAYFQTAVPALDSVNLNNITGAGLFPNLLNGATCPNAPTGQTYFYIHNIVRIPGQAFTQFAYPYFNPNATGQFKDGIVFYRGYNSGTWGSWAAIWSSNRTTTDANGFIKSASPIIRLSGSDKALPEDFGFHTIDLGQVNDQAVGTAITKTATGVYKITGSLGLHDTGWTIEIPQDNNGNRLCFVETETDIDGVITVSVFRRKFDVDTAMIVAGDAMDIPDGRWIDLRLEMPEYEQTDKEL